MENTLKMKRKDFEDDFSLSSPATKIRRLDAELLPIVQEVEQEPEIPIAFEQPAGYDGDLGPLIQELPENDERAIVLFKPLVQSPSSFSIKLNPHFTNGFKNQVLWGSNTCALSPVGDGNADEDSSGSSKECLAVVPWVPSQLPSTQGAKDLGQTDVLEMMEAEDSEGMTMDVEDSNVSAEQSSVIDAGALGLNEGLHQWQRQHCMMPQPPHNTSTPIVWYR